MRPRHLVLLALLSSTAHADVAPAFPMPTVRGAVIDLCTHHEVSDGTQSVKQRAVILGPAGLERFDADPGLAALGASTHARETITTRFTVVD